MQEILQDKIYLDESGEVAIASDDSRNVLSMLDDAGPTDEDM
ncbi:MAG: hypothetical protein R3C11_21855 [Planctomycetaceae bacterium]